RKVAAAVVEKNPIRRYENRMGSVSIIPTMEISNISRLRLVWAMVADSETGGRAVGVHYLSPG
ncbi:hypothetical protein ACHWGL_30650, partial [Klebsiella pneumoniae]|uniref:hypothetical protein n=1 Tax=Klebsiella pneumoniae TaxID=573 RepID=UPI00376F392C